jgi:two-component system response regulator YesN
MDVRMPGMGGLEATRLIRAADPHPKVVILTAHDEFGFSQEALRLGAVDYLLKPVRPSTLIEVVKRLKQQSTTEVQERQQAEDASSRLLALSLLVEAELLHDLLHRTIDVAVAANHLRAELGKDLTWPAVLEVALDHSEYLNQQGTGNGRDQLYRQWPSIVRRALPCPGQCLLAQLQPDVVVVAVSTTGSLATTEALRSLGHAIRSAVEVNAPVTASVGIGRRYPDLSQVHHSYAEAHRAQAHKLFVGGNAVIHIDDVAQTELDAPPYPTALERALMVQVRRGQAEASAELLRQIVDQLLDQPGYSSDAIRTRLLELLALLSRAAIEGGKPSADALRFAYERAQALANTQMANEIRIWAAAMLSGFMSHAEPQDQNDKIISLATKYLLENLHRPEISLGDVVAAVHVSPSHLAHLFRTRAGTSYSKHLAYLRLEEAKRLLAETELKIVTVAGRVGYADPTYFHRVFHRDTGVTPIEYRRQTRSVTHGGPP